MRYSRCPIATPCAVRRLSLAGFIGLLALAGCNAPPPSPRAVPGGAAQLSDAQRLYVAAKAACDREHRVSLADQADCRTHAANTYIRPYYRYGDLMSYAQDRRKSLAVEVDEHRISRGSYQRQMADAERYVSREEDRRNRLNHTDSSYEITPLTPVLVTAAKVIH